MIEPLNIDAWRESLIINRGRVFPSELKKLIPPRLLKEFFYGKWV